MKRAVRDSVAQIANHTSKSGASIQSETALDAGETKNSLLVDPLGNSTMGAWENSKEWRMAGVVWRGTVPSTT